MTAADSNDNMVVTSVADNTAGNTADNMADNMADKAAAKKKYCNGEVTVIKEAHIRQC
jgi:hypothetical protein